MSNSLKAGTNRVLAVLGCVFYFFALLWTVPGVWVFIFKALKLMHLMVTTGLPVPEKMHDHNNTLLLCALALYYMYFNKTISNFFLPYQIAKPVLVIGFTLFLGLTVTNNIIFRIANAGGADTALLFGVGLTGIVLTRVFMSLFFHRYPAEWFAGR